MSDLLIYVYADKDYEMFVLPFIFFALAANKTAHVEVILGNGQDSEILAKTHPGARELEEIYGAGRFTIRASGLAIDHRSTPNVRRFIEPPVSIAKYLYIGDIDIMIMEDVLGAHLPILEKYGLVYSNIVRDPNVENPRMTGLHFIKYEEFYPLPDIDDLDLARSNDEAVLYKIMERKGVKIDHALGYRPELGIHMSLSRDPVGRSSGPKQSSYSDSGLSWGGEKYYEKFVELIYSYDFSRVSKYFAVEFKLLCLIVESLSEGAFSKLSEFGFSYLTDRRKLIKHGNVRLKEALDHWTIQELYAAFPMRNEVTRRITDI